VSIFASVKQLQTTDSSSFDCNTQTQNLKLEVATEATFIIHCNKISGDLHTPKSNDTFSLLNQLLVEILELKVTLLK
jgi:hypothetical protein